MAVSKVLSGTVELSLLLVAPSLACPLPPSTLGVAHAALLGRRNPVSFFSMTDLQVFKSSNPVSCGWALGQAKHSRSRERVLLGHPRRWVPLCLASSLRNACCGHGVRPPAPGKGATWGSWFPSVTPRSVGVGGSLLGSELRARALAPASHMFQTSPGLPCVFSDESFPQSCPRQVRVPGLVRKSVLILVRTIYRRLPHGLQIAFLSPGNQRRNGLAGQSFENWSRCPPTATQARCSLPEGSRAEMGALGGGGRPGPHHLDLTLG